MNDELRRKFIEDYGLPISVFYDPWFTEEIGTLENYYGSKTKWNSLMLEIGERTPGQFIAQTREIRHEIRSWIEGNEAYLDFSKDKEIPETYKVSKDFPKKEIYKGDNVGKLYLSIDLKEANFQALRFYDPSIVRDCETWGEFIGRWSDSEYLKKTKLNRQRLLGKLSPEKQSIIETYIMVGIHKLFSDRWNLELVSLKTDEIIYQVPKELNREKLLGDALWISKNNMGVNVNAEIFELQPLQLFTHHGNSIFGFAKKIYGQEYPKFKDIPKMYIPQFIKYYEGRIEEVNELDLAFITPQEDELAKFIYPLHP